MDLRENVTLHHLASAARVTKCKEVTTPDTDQPLQFALDAVITVVLHVKPGLVWVYSYMERFPPVGQT